ncbi:MAG: DNA-directed RNA polymerase sigma-70 factor [Bacteroidota bacterium]|nr:MAG: ECF subfamily RNA polymerase sigma-24 subunit [Bacteroidetes bacterium OLB12]GIL22824.1 MAG: DNA-directed RNA polymerase sigma-70 factor [Bacteroidota bacterium]HNU42261.1 sigma-70 family RNA polymerase sigma factor [Cyclobacteriaceae bacterium]
MAVSEKEFVALVNENRGIIYKVIRLYIYHEEDTRDLYQEIVFQAWKSYPRFDGRSRFSTWLYRVGLNTVLTFKRRPVVVVPHEDLASLNVAQTKTNTDESEALYAAIRQLPEIDRMIISLHLDGYENEEIAEITGLTKNNTAVKLHRIKDILIKKLKAE